MSDYKYLKDQLYYSDLYDRLTVEQGLRIEESIKNSTVQDEKLTAEERKDAFRWVNHIYIYVFTGERYLNKKDTIEKWMELDKAKDQKIENALPPKGVTCLTCGSKMHLESKDLRELNGIDQAYFYSVVTRDVKSAGLSMRMVKNIYQK